MCTWKLLAVKRKLTLEKAVRRDGKISFRYDIAEPLRKAYTWTFEYVN